MSAAIQACTQSAIDYSEIPKSYKSRYAWRVDYRAYVKRTGKSQDFLVRHSKIGCHKCGRDFGLCSNSWSYKERKHDRVVGLKEYLSDANIDN